MARASTKELPAGPAPRHADAVVFSVAIREGDAEVIGIPFECRGLIDVGPSAAIDAAPAAHLQPHRVHCAARVKGLPIATIARLYFDTDTTEPLEVERLLRTMRDDLVARALQEGSSVLVSHLHAANAKHGVPRLTPVSLQMIEQVAGVWPTAASAMDTRSTASSDCSWPTGSPANVSRRSLSSSRAATGAGRQLGGRSVPVSGPAGRVLVAWLAGMPTRSSGRAGRRRGHHSRSFCDAVAYDRAGPRPVGAARPARRVAPAVRRANKSDVSADQPALENGSCNVLREGVATSIALCACVLSCESGSDTP